MSPAERQQHYDVGIAAVQSIHDHGTWADRIRRLGFLRYEPAVPAIAALWRYCPVQPVRVAAAHALFTIGTAECRDVLREGVDDEDHLARFMALKVGFTDDQPAWDSLGWLFSVDRLATDVGTTVAYDALRFLSPSSYSREGPGWTLDELRTLLADDARWLDLCVSLRTHPILGAPAREALKAADPAVTGPALDRAAAAAARSRKAGSHRLAIGTTLLARYEAGDHQRVWQELRMAGDLDDRLRDIVRDVAIATMHRVRRNAEALASALADAGWPIQVNEAVTAPWHELDQRLAELDELVGAPVPPALEAFWRIVGGIHLVPYARKAPAHVPSALIMLDPLEIEDPENVWFEVDEWAEERDRSHPELAGPIELPVAPDHYHKADISGGDPYSVRFPDATADPFVHDESHRLHLTDYLRLAFANRGFLRLHDDEGDPQAEAWLADLRFEAEPF